MEYLRGESLRQTLDRVGRLAPNWMTIAAIAGMVADALHAAHATGIVHRDLKPDNTYLTAQKSQQAELTVKVLDFDLSPEQARGLPAGPRSDIFAFGCLLLECLAGRRAFAGSGAAELHAAVLRAEPEWSRLPAGTPERVRELLGRCLAKDPELRPAGMADVRAALEEEMEHPPSGRTRLHNLPRELTSFVGREEELARIVEEQRSAALLTLTGPGGCGKTRLALRAGLELLPDLPEGVWLVELASTSDPGRVAAAVAAVLEVREKAGGTAAEAVVEAIGDRAMLLILDNCEHLVEACAGLALQLIRSCPRLKILATSREILGVAGEVPFRVPSLSLPPADDALGPEDLTRYEACRLFLERARAASPAFRVGAAEAPAIGRICRLLDGIPLAIELAAARTRLLRVEQIQARLDDRFRLLTGGSRTALERHQTLRATLDWSYALLTEEEQRWLRSLSVFAGGWSLEGGIAVGGADADEFETLDALTRLADKSLVVVEAEGAAPRYRMLEMVRQYAREKLEAEGEVEAVRGRHLEYCLGLVERSRAHLFGGAEQKRWLDLLDAEHENLQGAFRWSQERTGGEIAGLKLVAWLGQFWHLRGHGRLARELLLRALEHERGSGAPADDERLGWRAGALNVAAHFLTVEGEFARARELIEEAVAVRRRIGPPLDLARVLFTLGANGWMSNRFEEARRAHEEALAIARELGHRDMTAACLNALGANRYQQGDLEGARRYFEESLALRREEADRPNIAMVLNNLGTMAALQGDFATARARQEEALSIQRELDNAAGVLAVLQERGNLAVEMGEGDAALRDFGEALEIARRLGEKPRLAGLYAAVAAAHRRAGRLELAVAPLRQALEMYREIGSSVDSPDALLLAASLAADRGDFTRAARLFGAADAHRGASEMPVLPGEAALIRRSRETARAGLGETAFDAAAVEGAGLSSDAAMEEALASLEA